MGKRFRLTMQEHEDIREALFSKVEQFRDNIKVLESVEAQLAAGCDVALFAKGDAGIRAAKGMKGSFQQRAERMEALAVKISAHLYGEGEG